MSKMLLVSDNHGSKKELNAIVNRHKEEVDLFIHCGDSELPYDSDEMSPFIKVKGNCDFDSNYPTEQLEMLNELPVYITHGHLYNVKMSLINITYRAHEMNAKIVCFGHSHLAFAQSDQEVVLINPGSISLPRARKEKTYAICTLEANVVKVDFFDDEGNIIAELCKKFEI